MENLEQPKQESLGSNEMFGKFKDAESLFKAYTNLEAEFTKKSQKLATLEQESEKASQLSARQAEIDKRVDDFVTKFDIAKPFSSALKESLTNSETADLGEEAVKLIANNYKTADEYATDDEFLKNYIYSNEIIKDKIIKDYIANVTQNTPIKVASNSNILLSKPNLPTTVKEAGKLARNIIKEK